jgi:hypothetical protein
VEVQDSNREKKEGKDTHTRSQSTSSESPATGTDDGTGIDERSTKAAQFTHGPLDTGDEVDDENYLRGGRFLA